MEYNKRKNEKKTDPPFDPNLDKRFPDELIVKIVKARLMESDCLSKGFILDGYPKKYQDAIGNYKARISDTRKTTPNMRPFEKYAVTVGGATNHRYNLSDGVLLKDNHIGAAGSITRAIEMAKAYAPFVRKIEIETETIEQVKEALDAGADIIMLDNMTNEVMRKCVELINGKAQTECSGNVTKERLREIAEIGVDFVSCGALTHSAPIMDLSLKNLIPTE